MRIWAGTRASDESPLTIGPYLFRPGAKLLVQGARKVRLTEKETDILKFLHAAGATVARDTLLHEVWGYNPAVTTHTLETHIYRLRKKIEENPGEAPDPADRGRGLPAGAPPRDTFPGRTSRSRKSSYNGR